MDKAQYGTRVAGACWHDCLLVPPLFMRGALIPTTGPFLYLLTQQCHINWLSFSTMAGVCACS